MSMKYEGESFLCGVSDFTCLLRWFSVQCMCISITWFLNHGSFAGSLRNDGEKKNVPSIFHNLKLSDFQIEKNKDI